MFSCEQRVTGETGGCGGHATYGGQWSLRMNDQFRICFRWTGSDAEDVEIVDYD